MKWGIYPVLNKFITSICWYGNMHMHATRAIGTEILMSYYFYGIHQFVPGPVAASRRPWKVLQAWRNSFNRFISIKLLQYYAKSFEIDEKFLRMHYPVFIQISDAKILIVLPIYIAQSRSLVLSNEALMWFPARVAHVLHEHTRVRTIRACAFVIPFPRVFWNTQHFIFLSKVLYFFGEKMLVLFETPAGYAIFKVCEYTVQHFESFTRVIAVFLRPCTTYIFYKCRAILLIWNYLQYLLIIFLCTVILWYYVQAIGLYCWYKWLGEIVLINTVEISQFLTCSTSPVRPVHIQNL
jgi:hypothetical protein